MNAKKKNKKAHKPPNPNPPQSLEQPSKPEEKVQEVEPICEVKEEQTKIPGVCSEVVATPVSDVKDVESEMPKKPKRNKGKKKKQDKDENLMENQPEKQEIHIESSVKFEEAVQNLIAEDKGNEEKKDNVDVDDIVPSARKKKNKNKTQDKQLEELQILDVISVPVQENPPKTTAIQELLCTMPEAPKQDAKKKKNKRKNRNDSEKSDKSENVLSCTTAFQSLLQQDEILIKDKSDVKTDDIQELKDNDSLDNIQKTFDIVKNFETLALDEGREEPLNIKPLSKDENKSKKKNKKDKKQAQSETVSICPQDVPTVKDEELSQDISFNERRQDVTELADIPIETNKEVEPSPKPKSKFAKPVEKKRQGKLDAPSSENDFNIDSPFKEDKDGEISKKPELKLVETSNVELQISEQGSQTPSSIEKTIENIRVPSDHTMGKKRKKSPKPQKSAGAHTIDEKVVEMAEKIQSEKQTEITESATSVLDLIQPVTQSTSSEIEKAPSNTVEVPPEDISLPKNDQKILESPLHLEKRDDEGFEIKTSKKKKKTPKIPQSEITSEVKEPKTPKVPQEEIASEVKEPRAPTDIKKVEVSPEKPKVQTKEITDISSDVPSGANLEGQSATTDFETSSLDVIPDILFMRSSSQHVLDNNNNTVIQELLYVDEIKLNDPLLIPLIEGSGETPTPTPESVSFGITLAEMGPKTLQDEKTDIKSKMMEVNQDMEELRISIERSLAEFTALDKNNESEIKCDNKHLLNRENSPIRDQNSTVSKVERTITAVEPQENVSAEIEVKKSDKLNTDPHVVEMLEFSGAPPACPTRKDNKGKSKTKKKGKQELVAATTSATTSESNTTQSKDNAKEEKQEKSEQKTEKKSESTQEKGKQQSITNDSCSDKPKDIKTEQQPMCSELIPDSIEQADFDPIENFEDALTSSIDDVNKTFEMIVKDVDDENIESLKKLAAKKPEINITEATDDKDSKRNERVNPVSQPKNLLGQIDFPVQSNKTDYKKEKNKTPNARQARVKIKDAMDIEAKVKQSKESQTDGKAARKISDKSVKETFSKVKNDTEEYVYKYSFRKVFLQSACQVCNKDLKQVRMPCVYCNLVFYCGSKHKDEDWPQHQALCFAVSTLAHMKDQKHIYADAQHATGQDYRLLRMQMIVSCEKILKRRLVPWEQEAMLYPRICADVACREWRQGKLKDCDGCGQLSYCAAHPGHLPKSHSRWCKSYSLYTKLVSYQQTKGRLEPHLPTKLLKECEMPGKMNEVLAAMYEEKIDMNDIQYASLTQLATAPLTTAYCLQLCRSATGFTNGVSKSHITEFTIHVVGAELQFEADALNKWETFFLHLRPDVDVLKVVLVSSMLNPGNLPLDLLGRIKLCDDCKQKKRSVVFKFEDNKNYFEYRTSEDFVNPDIICAFNPSIQRSSIYNGKDPWPATINSILKLKQPFVVTSYTLNELRKDIARVKEVADMDFKLILEAGFNSFASVRPDRNFISDDEIPLLFKNYCVAVLLGC